METTRRPENHPIGHGDWQGHRTLRNCAWVQQVREGTKEMAGYGEVLAENKLPTMYLAAA